MGSRIRSNPDKIFELFVEVARPTSNDEEPFILQKFPPSYDDKETLKSIPKFAFPCEAENGGNVEHFSFVLTDIDSNFRFGFCRHASGAQTCLCILSCLPWFEIFYKLLNDVAEIMNKTDNCDVMPLLRKCYEHHIPEPGEHCDVIAPNFSDKFSFVAPDPNQLPSVPENRNLVEYFNAIDVNNMMKIWASMLFERRVLIVSKKLSKVTACVHAAVALIYPLCWQHIFIPLLPPHLSDYCTAPMPYVIGIHHSMLKRLRIPELGDAIIVDADQNTMVTDHQDLASLPHGLVSDLKKRLRSDKADKVSSQMVGDWLSRSFLKAMVSLIGGYRDALTFRPGEPISFNPEAFAISRGPALKPLLTELMTLQTFEQFKSDRLDMLNSGEGFQDEFEVENQMDGDKWGSQKRYQDWSAHMKSIRKGGKERWTEFAGKANPAMRSAMSKVKDKTKKAYHGITTKIDEFRESPEKIPTSGGISRSRPTTIPNASPVPQRPPRPLGPNSFSGADKVKPHPAIDNDVPRAQKMHTSSEHTKRFSRDVTGWSRQYKVLDFDSLQSNDQSARVSKRLSSADSTLEEGLVTNKQLIGIQGGTKRQSHDDSDLDLSFNRVSLDLLQDPDIQQMFVKSYSVEDLGNAMADHLHSSSSSEASSTRDAYEALVEEPMSSAVPRHVMSLTSSQSAHAIRGGSENEPTSQNSHNTAHSNQGVTRETNPAVTKEHSSSLAPPTRPPRPSLAPTRAAPPLPVTKSLVPERTAFSDLESIHFIDTSNASLDQSQFEPCQPIQSRILSPLASSSTSNIPLSSKSSDVDFQSLSDNRNSLGTSASLATLQASSSSGSLESVKFGDGLNKAFSSSTLNESVHSSSNNKMASICEKSPHTSNPPVPAKRSSVIRRNAFNKPSSGTRPSLRTSPVATDAQTINAARTAFMRTGTVPKTSLRESSGSIDDFDPLSTGQLVCDEHVTESNSRISGSSKTLNSSAKDEDLLKDWSLNFSSASKKLQPVSSSFQSAASVTSASVLSHMAASHNVTVTTQDRVPMHLSAPRGFVHRMAGAYGNMGSSAPTSGLNSGYHGGHVGFHRAPAFGHPSQPMGGATSQPFGTTRYSSPVAHVTYPASSMTSQTRAPLSPHYRSPHAVYAPQPYRPTYSQPAAQFSANQMPARDTQGVFNASRDVTANHAASQDPFDDMLKRSTSPSSHTHPAHVTNQSNQGSKLNTNKSIYSKPNGNTAVGNKNVLSQNHKSTWEKFD